MVLTGRRRTAFWSAQTEEVGAMRNGRGLACPFRLEGSSVEKPDGQRADSDDAEEDQREGDVRLTLGVVLGETVHLVLPRPCGAEGDRTPDLMSAIHALSQLSYSPIDGGEPFHKGTRRDVAGASPLRDPKHDRGIAPEPLQ